MPRIELQKEFNVMRDVPDSLMDLRLCIDSRKE